MHILISGAAGMIGRKLSARLVKDTQLNGKKIDRLTLIDVVAPEKPGGFAGTAELSASDLSSPSASAKAIAGKPDVIFHLAGVVSGVGVGVGVVSGAASGAGAGMIATEI